MCTGHIMTEGNTLLGDKKLEKLTILRMNRNFVSWKPPKTAFGALR